MEGTVKPTERVLAVWKSLASTVGKPTLRVRVRVRARARVRGSRERCPLATAPFPWLRGGVGGLLPPLPFSQRAVPRRRGVRRRQHPLRALARRCLARVPRWHTTPLASYYACGTARTQVSAVRKDLLAVQFAGDLDGHVGQQQWG